MNIAQIMDLDVGMKGITCSGKVTWANKPKNITGTSGGKDYDFWSQFIVIEDNTGKIGVSITVEVETNECPVGKGEMVTIEKAELKQYIKDGEPMLKLQGKLQYQAQQNAPQNQQQGTQQATGGTKPPPERNNTSTWKQLDREMVEKDVICALLASRKRPDPSEVKVWTDYIMDGIHPDSKQQDNTNPEHSDDPPRTDENGLKF